MSTVDLRRLSEILAIGKTSKMKLSATEVKIN